MSNVDKTAFKLFRILNGPGDWGSESEFYAQANNADWRRLARYFLRHREKEKCSRCCINPMRGGNRQGSALCKQCWEDEL